MKPSGWLEKDPHCFRGDLDNDGTTSAAQAVLEVLDSGPPVPLYVISKLKEEDRDEMIIDRLPLENNRKVHAYRNAKQEGNDAEKNCFAA